MRYRKLTADGDYSFGNGQADFYRDVPEAVGQSVLTRLRLWLGEWYLDITQGTPYPTGVLGKKTKEQADVTIQDRITTTDGMVDIQNYTSAVDPDNRDMTVSVDLDTIYGPTQLDIENYANY